MPNDGLPNVLSGGPHRLRRAKPMPTDLLEQYSKGEASRPESPGPPSPSDPLPGKLLRLWLRPPWEDYTSLRPVSREPSMAYRRGAYFQKAAIRVFPNSGGIGLLQTLSDIQHPNIAKFYDVYCCDNKIFIASEYLELSLMDLDFQSFPAAEWEIATIIFEVRALQGLEYTR